MPRTDDEELSEARALLSRAAATILEHLASLPKCIQHTHNHANMGNPCDCGGTQCGSPAVRGYGSREAHWCDKHRPDQISVADYNAGWFEDGPMAKTVRELQALLVEIEGAK